MRSRLTPLAFLPAVVVTTLLITSKNSLWPAVIGYHALCLVLPLAYRRWPKDAGLTVSDVRRWLPPTTAISIALLAAGELGRHIRLEPLLPYGWQQVLR